MWNQFEFFNKSVNDKIKTKAKGLLVGWAIWSLLVFVLFVAFWLWHGMPKGPDGVLRTLCAMGAISVLAPPVVWLVGKALIG